MKSKTLIVALCALLFVQAKAQELLNYPLDTVNGEEVYRYQVEKSIGLYRVGVNFNVPQSEIIRLNPHLRERGLHYDEILLLPTGRKVVKSEEVIVKSEEVRDTVVTEVQDTVVTESRDSVIPEVQDTVVTTDTVATEPDNRRVVELALLLPFESHQTKRSGNAERMMEFYQGALLALHALQNDSILYRLRVYDTERSERRVQALCDSTELDSVQAILGLVYPIQIERMAEWCALHQVPLLLPFSNDMDLASHPYVMQFNSSDQQEADSLCNWLESHQEDVHIVLTEVKEADISSSVRTLRKQMKARGIGYTALPLHDLMNDSAAYALDPEKENLIVLHSDRYQQIRILLPHIMTLRHVGYRVRLVSRYAWQKDQIELPQVYTSMFTQNGDKEGYDALWEQTYKTQHTSEHPRYDLLGYDLMQALVQVVRGSSEPMNGLQSTIQWKQVQQGGYQNACVGVIAY